MVRALSLVLSPAQVAAWAQATVLVWVSMAILGLAMEGLVTVLTQMDPLQIQAETVMTVGIDERMSTWLWRQNYIASISWMVV